MQAPDALTNRRPGCSAEDASISRRGISCSPCEGYAPRTAAPANRTLEYLRHRSEYLRHYWLFGEDTRMREAD